MAGSKAGIYVDVRGYNHKVTGSCIRITIHFSDREKYRILVDYGAYQGVDEKENKDELLSYNDCVTPSKIDAVLLTHTHLDHDGALPLFMKNGYENKIYMSTASRVVLPISLEDGFNVMKNAAKAKKMAPIYTEENIQEVLHNSVAIDFEESCKLSDNIKITFFNNGHLVGASIILIQIKDSYTNDRINILCTGDYKDSNTFLRINKIPKWVYQLDNLTIISESTYGTTYSSEIKEEFASNVITACKKSCTIVIPVFAQGRMQEIMYQIRKLQMQNAIPSDYIVEVAGKSGIEYTFNYIKNREILQFKKDIGSFFPNNLHFVDAADTYNVNITGTERKIIITTSGMGNYGPANSYIPEALSNSRAMIHFTGYQAEGTLGRKLLETPYGEDVTIKGMLIPKRAQVCSTNEFSSHAKADELIDFINRFESRAVLVTHGEPEVKSSFAKMIARETNTRKVGILGNELVYRIGPYGIIKSIEK